MKKIVSVLALSALVVGAVSAQVSVQLDNSNKMGLFTYNKKDGEDATTGQFKYYTENRFYLKFTNEDNTYGLNFVPRFNLGTSPSATSTDTVVSVDNIKLKDGNIDPDTLIDTDGDGVQDSIKITTTSETTTKNVAISGIFYRIEWDAFVKLGKYAKVTFGNFDSRNANRAAKDAKSFDVMEMAKLGYSNFANPNATNGKIGYGQTETDQLAGAGNTNLNLVLDAYVGPVTLQLGVRNKSGSKDGYTDYFVNNWGARVFTTIPNIAKLTATVTTGDRTYSSALTDDARDKADNKNEQLNVGIFADVIAIKDLNLVLGYSGGFPLKDGKTIGNAKKDEAIHAVNLRAYLPLLDNKLTITTHDDFSFTTLKANDKSAVSMYNMVNVAYAVNSNIVPALYFANHTLSSDGNMLGVIMIAPRASVTITKNVTLDIGPEFRVDYSDVKDFKSTTNVQIPLNLRIQVK